MERRLAAVLVLLAVVANACTGQAETTMQPALLPPHERDDLAALFDPLVEPLGYRVTRASLIDRSTYQVDAEGGHLALYVAPLTDISADQFAAAFPSLISVFLPFVFDQWPELHSFDVCQEPFNSPDETPPSLTIIDLTRQAATTVEWDQLDLAAVINLNEKEGISVWARAAVRDSATWRAAAGF